MRAQAGLTFFRENSIFPQGTALWRVRASKPRIVTINNIDGVSGLMRAHTRWAKKHPSMFHLLSPRFGCKKPIKNLFTFWSHQKNTQKSRSQISQFLHYISENVLRTYSFSPLVWEIIKNPCVFSANPEPLFWYSLMSHVSCLLSLRRNEATYFF